MPLQNPCITVRETESADVAGLSLVCGLLSEPMRVRLFLAVAGGERCVTDLCDMLGGKQPTVSHHLGLLRRGGLLATRRDGKRIFYGLGPRAGRHGGARAAAPGRRLRHLRGARRRRARPGPRRARRGARAEHVRYPCPSASGKPKGDESAPRPSRQFDEMMEESRRLIEAGEDTLRRLKELTTEIAENRRGRTSPWAARVTLSASNERRGDAASRSAPAARDPSDA